MCLKKKINHHQNHKICRVNLLCNNILYFALFAIDFFCRFGYNSLRQFAGVMELADVLDSKSSGSNTVRVRPPPPAPRNTVVHNTMGYFFYFYVEEVLISSVFPSIEVQKSSMLGFFYACPTVEHPQFIQLKNSSGNCRDV